MVTYEMPACAANFLICATLISTGKRLSLTFCVRKSSPFWNDEFGIRFTGYVDVPQDGMYSFSTVSDDGSRLFIGTTAVLDNDGIHAAEESTGHILLQAGLHAITVLFFDGGGGEELTVLWEGPAFTRQKIPDDRLYRSDGAPMAARPPLRTRQETHEDIRVSLLPGYLMVNGLSGNQSGVLTVGDLHGRTVTAIRITQASSCRIPFSGSSGVYVVTMRRGGETIPIRSLLSVR